MSFSFNEGFWISLKKTIKKGIPVMVGVET